MRFFINLISFHFISFVFSLSPARSLCHALVRLNWRVRSCIEQVFHLLLLLLQTESFIPIVLLEWALSLQLSSSVGHYLFYFFCIYLLLNKTEVKDQEEENEERHIQNKTQHSEPKKKNHIYAADVAAVAQMVIIFLHLANFRLYYLFYFALNERGDRACVRLCDEQSQLVASSFHQMYTQNLI